MTKDPEILTEYVRQRLGRAIVKPLLSEDETLRVLTVDSSIEEAIRNSLQQTEHGVFLTLDPAIAQKIINSVQKAIEHAVNSGYSPVILTNPTIRRHLRRLIERFVSDVHVLSHSEIPGNIRLESIGVITME